MSYDNELRITKQSIGADAGIHEESAVYLYGNELPCDDGTIVEPE